MTTPRKTFHLDEQIDYHLTVMLDCWVAVTALLGASTSTLEADGWPLSDLPATIERGDQSLVALLRRDRLT